MAFTPYSTAVSLFGQKPSWIPSELDQLRIQSYQLYEQIYWNVPDIFALTARGTNDKAIYIPTARTIIDTTNRYTASGFSVAVEARDNSTVVSQDMVAAQLVLKDWMVRERFKSKFTGAKRYGLIRGDWIWHITANPVKELGKRISITALDPAMYFPITDDEDVDKVIGCHLVEQITNQDGDPRIRRLTYRKTDAGGITVEEGIFEVDSWGGPDFKPEIVVRPVTALPPTITALPVYHIKNFEEPGNPFGSSEIRGFERIMAAVNQSISDEDLALALEGIGMYATDAPEPTDDNGKKIAWQLGPGRVVHIPPDTKFQRVDGVGSVAPFQDHIGLLTSMLREASSTPDIAIGSVDVKVAQSGIALALQLEPMLAKSAEKNELIIDTHGQLFYDLINGWYPAYEETTFENVNVLPIVGDPVPIDRQARFQELGDMLDRGIIDTDFYRAQAVKLGYQFPDGMAEKAAAEFSARQSLVDPVAARTDAELE